MCFEARGFEGVFCLDSGIPMAVSVVKAKHELIDGLCAVFIVFFGAFVGRNILLPPSVLVHALSGLMYEPLRVFPLSFTCNYFGRARVFLTYININLLVFFFMCVCACLNGDSLIKLLI